MNLHPILQDTVDSALGRQHRDDPVRPGTGGPAGNAQLTAWLGLGLLVLFVAELVTLVDLNGLIGWHIVLGVLLVPPALAKAASTGWRIVRYYGRSPGYVQAGPPPLLLRLLGPLVIAGTLAVLGTGSLLIGLGPTSTFRPWFTILGQDISPLVLHKVSFIGWAVVTGLHLLARFLPALQYTSRDTRAVPGTARRVLLVVGLVVVAAGAALVVYDLSTAWTGAGFRPRREG